ncbi:14216_t:CDS:2 [Entrophospora sp. SA101]|nr:14216_t:CDS:2 [Entrophospora sp. SA101]
MPPLTKRQKHLKNLSLRKKTFRKLFFIINENDNEDNEDNESINNSDDGSINDNDNESILQNGINNYKPSARRSGCLENAHELGDFMEVKAKNFKAGGINAFIIYRASYVKELKTSTGDKISMRYISKYISEMWNKEPIGVKNHYRQLSSQLENELTEIRRENLVYIDNNESNYKKRRRTTKTTQNQISISEGIITLLEKE